MKQINGFERYLISPNGLVYDTKLNIYISNWIDNTGYLMCILKKEGKKYYKRIHKLVADAYIPNPYNLPQVNHKDGVKNNNCVDNLEWCTQSENEQHSVKILGKCMKGKTNSKSVYCIDLDKCFPSMKQTVEFLGNRACIEGLKKAIQADRLYHGHKFKFIESSTTIENTSDKGGSE